MQAHLFSPHDELSDEVIYVEAIPFIVLHVLVLGIFWTGFTTTSVVLCITFYWLRVLAITMGYHRYFSHRSFKTGRVIQFLLAFIGGAALQRDALWWAAKHRAHHRDSDTPEDGHSPRHYGFWGAHVSWVFRPRRFAADMPVIQDFSKYPELRWLQQNQLFPGAVIALICVLTDGLPGFFVGFVLSTLLVYHATFFINSLAHVLGKQRYLTGDDSRNHWLLAVMAAGEGWHNNHHYYPASARNGFFWYEWDPTYYVIWVLEKLGWVWDVQRPPQSILRNEKKTTQAIIEKTAGHIAAGFSVEKLATQIRQAWMQQGAQWDELVQRARSAAAEAEAQLKAIELPQLPSLEEIRQSARLKFANVPSLEDAILRARLRLREAVTARLLNDALAQQPV